MLVATWLRRRQFRLIEDTFTNVSFTLWIQPADAAAFTIYFGHLGNSTSAFARAACHGSGWSNWAERFELRVSLQAFHPRTHDNLRIVGLSEVVVFAFCVPHDDFARRGQADRFEPSAIQWNCVVLGDVRNLPAQVAVLIFDCEVVDQVLDELRLVRGKFDVSHERLQICALHFRAERTETMIP